MPQLSNSEAKGNRLARNVKRRGVPQEQIEAAEREIIDRSRRIEFYMTEYSVELLVEKMARDDFIIPAYQREYTWSPHHKARFIESLHMGLPIPFLFFWEMGSGKLEIVDGSQRIRTLLEYVRGGLKLAELDELPSLSRTTFDDMPASRQRKLLNRSIRGIVLNEHADEQARFDMFERINTSSKVANTAEVRRGALRGHFQQMVEELARSPKLAALAPVSSKSEKERIPEELVTRFFAYGDGLEDYRDSPSRFIFDYTRSMNARFVTEPHLQAEYRERFERMLTFVEGVFPYGFRKGSTAKATPRVRFEAIAIGSDLALRERPSLATETVPPVADWIDGEEFRVATTSDAANVRSKLEGRIQFVRQKLLGA
jgi:hypothetical protein